MSESRTPKTKAKTIVKEQQGYYEMPERYEIIAGIRYDFLSSPKYVHQKILTNFHLAFHGACNREGEILLAPLDVHFDEDNIVQPDVIYIARERMDIVRDGYIYGAPDLLVEILSESTGRRDKTIKKELYERFGVKEYWLADPIYRTVEQYVMEKNGKYRYTGVYAEQDAIDSPSIPCLSVSLDAIFPPEEQ